MHNYNFTSLEQVSLNPIIQKFWRISFSILIIIMAFLFLPWQQTVKGVGSVIALEPTQRVYNVLATIDGFVDKFHVEENQFVKKGDILFSMVDLDREYSQKLNNIQENIQKQQINLNKQVLISQDKKENIKEYLKLGVNVYTKKFEQIKNKIKSLNIKKIYLEKSYEIEKLNFQRIELLYKDGIESKRKYDRLENIYIKAKAELDKMAIDIVIEKNNINILNQEKEKFLKETQNKIKSLQNTILSSENKINSLSQAIQRQSMLISRYARSEVYAQKDGYVVRLFQNDKNKLIKKGEKILYFAPIVSVKSILVRFSDFNMPLIKKGLPTRIVFYGWPAMQISGWPVIKRGTFGGIIKKIDSISYEKGFYYAYIVEDPDEPWPKGDILKIGTQASVWVRLQTVPIWYQLWRTMNALPPQMLEPIISKK